MKNFITLVFLSLMASITTAQDALALTTARIYTNNTAETLPYRIFIPEKIPRTPIPLVIFLHGAGERGTDNRAQVVHGVGDLITYTLNNQPMLIIAPQCPENKRWSEVDWSKLEHTMPEAPSYAMRLSLQLIEELRSEFQIDRSRLYITGLSMGGYGTWDIIQRHPEMFAAAMPVCGGGDIAGAPLFKDLPIWVFHGDKDGSVPVTRSRDMVEALRKCGSTVKYTEYAGVGHNCWERTYANPEVLRWFFSQKR